MTSAFQIRTATAEDSAEISELIVNVAKGQLRNEFTDEGWELFLRLISRQTQQGLIADHQFNYWVACVDETQGKQKIIGILSSKNLNHIFHLFILPEHQRQGVGQALWNNYLFHLPSHSSPVITVKSSEYAYKFYIQLGFIQQQPRCIENGLAYTLMHYSRKT